MTAPARTAAYHAVRAVSSGRADLPSALHASRAHLTDERDRSLAAEIVTGTFRWQRSLDHLIEHFSRRRITKLDSEIVEILRLSLYQLLHLSRVPASAVVDDAVNLTRRAGKTSATGFVNAMLRQVSRKRKELPLPPRPIDPDDRAAALDYLSVTLSHPRWLAARWLERFGFDAAEARMRFDNAAGSLTLRANRLRITRDDMVTALAAEEIVLHPTRYAPDGAAVAEGNPLRSRLFDQGFFFVQDEASQLVALLAGDRPSRRVLDACASPGGKTTSIAAAMEGRGLLVATDLRARRIEL